jgi:hypothetical protein
LAVAFASQPAQARTKKLVAIDELCRRLRSEFIEAQPAIFSGPNPWVPLERAPSRLREGTLAYVYSEGPLTRWVVLLIEGPHHAWSETVNYFFASNGQLLKRERYLEDVTSNTALEENRYYENGELLNRSTGHHALKSGHENSDQFNDQDAPEFISVDDLPFPVAPDVWRGVSL